ncbi:MAG: hypothetical protein RIC55_36330 [Pirellulaceae bacterium]
MAKPINAEDFKLQSSYEEIRKTLLEETYSDRLEKPLAYWALPNDRRLPLAFLGRTIGDLLATPFQELNATPGIGQKKIHSLVRLLHRAVEEQSPAAPEAVHAGNGRPDQDVYVDGRFDSSSVSELQWAAWRETVKEHGLNGERIGRVARSLRDVPTVIWNTPLDFYLHFSLAEMRELKTHGEKRVRVVLEVFYFIHQLLSGVDPDGHLSIRLAPRMVGKIETWIQQVLRQDAVPSLSELRNSLAETILMQIDLDTGPTVVELARGRMGLEGPPQTVRLQSRRMGVTRARVYQLLDDCSKLFDVRWPCGRLWLERLIARCQGRTDEKSFQLLRSISELLYPDKYERMEEEG